MPRYKVVGADRAAGALGVLSQFVTIVEAADEAAARKHVREDRYRNGREHVHIASVREMKEGV